MKKIAGLLLLLILCSTSETFAEIEGQQSIPVEFLLSVDDYVELYIDGELVANYDAAPWGETSATLNLSPGWHEIHIVYENRYGSNALRFFRKYANDAEFVVVPLSELRSIDEHGNTINGLRADYDSFTIYGEGPIYHGWSNLYQGEPGAWGGVYGDYDQFTETLSGQILIEEPPPDIPVDFLVSVDDYLELYIDEQLVAEYDALPWGETSASLELSPGWHDIRIEYENRAGSNALRFFRKYTNDTEYEIVPLAELRSQDDQDNTINGLRADYDSFTIYGEGPIYHGWSNLYQGEPGAWGGVYGDYDQFTETLSGQILIEEPPPDIPVDFLVSVDDYLELYIDEQLVAEYDALPWGETSASLELSPGWHDIRIEYENRAGSNALRFFRKYTNDTEYEIVPLAELRSQDDQDNTINGLRADYDSFTIYGEGPIYHGWSNLYQGEPGAWGGVYGDYDLFAETLIGQILIMEPCIPPTVSPEDVVINNIGNNNIQLTWTAVAGANIYEVWHHDNNPYFMPGNNCQASANCILETGNLHKHIGALGVSSENMAFVIYAAHSCGTRAAEMSNRTAEFDFDLIPGTS